MALAKENSSPWIKMLGFYSEPARAIGFCVYEAMAPPVKIQAALSLTWGRQRGRQGWGWEPWEVPTNQDGLLAEQVSKLKKLNKSRKKGNKRNIAAREKKRVYQSHSVSVLFTFPPKVIRRDSHGVLMRSYRYWWK